MIQQHSYRLFVDRKKGEIVVIAQKMKVFFFGLNW
jgi:hypothetical protein